MVRMLSFPRVFSPPALHSSHICNTGLRQTCRACGVNYPTQRSRLSLRSRRLDLRPSRRNACADRVSARPIARAPKSPTWSHVIKLETLHDTKRDWDFYREAGRKMLWPHIDAEYQQELEGIAKGVAVQGRQARCVGHRRAERQYRAAVSITFPGSTSASTPRTRHSILPGWPLLGLYRHRQLHQGRQDRDRAQQLVELCRG